MGTNFTDLLIFVGNQGLSNQDSTDKKNILHLWVFTVHPSFIANTIALTGLILGQISLVNLEVSTETKEHERYLCNFCFLSFMEKIQNIYQTDFETTTEVPF